MLGLGPTQTLAQRFVTPSMKEPCIIPTSKSETSVLSKSGDDSNVKFVMALPLLRRIDGNKFQQGDPLHPRLTAAQPPFLQIHPKKSPMYSPVFHYVRQQWATKSKADKSMPKEVAVLLCAKSRSNIKRAMAATLKM